MSTINEAIQALSINKPVVLQDDLSEHPCGYLLHSTENISEKEVCELVNIAGGLTLAAISEKHLEFLAIHPMLKENSKSSPDLTVSVEARHGVSTGISASDRAKTLKVLSQTEEPERDLVTPGHIFPIIAKDGGVLVRHGAPEAAIDIMNFANLSPVCAMSHCLDETGELLSPEGIKELSKTHSIPLISISDVIEYRLEKKPIIKLSTKKTINLQNDVDLECFCFTSQRDSSEHLAFKRIIKNKEQKAIPLVRVQSEKLFSDALGINSLSSRESIQKAIAVFNQREDVSVFVYIRHPKNNVLSKEAAKLKAQKQSYTQAQESTAQIRELGIGAQILRQLGLTKIALLTNSERVVSGLKPFGISIKHRETY